MHRWKARVAVIGLGVATILLGAPRESQAIFSWLCPSGWGCSQPTYSAGPVTYGYAPSSYSCAPACGTCAPQTTSYPASGCTTCYQTTTYRPFLSWLSCRPRYSTSYYCAPYSTYRCAYPSACCPTTTCMPTSVCSPYSCADTACGVPSYTSSVSVCGPAGCAPAATTAPSYYDSAPSTSSESEAPSTFKSESQNNGQPRLRPTPDQNTSPAPTSTPRLIFPLPQVTSRPMLTASYTREVYRPVRAASKDQSGLDVSGWRASRD
jgi:hypothetical protein